MSQEIFFRPSTLPPFKRMDGRGAASVARRLGLHSRLGADSEAALERLLGRPTRFEGRALIAEAGEEADLITIVQDGFACRVSTLPDGRRQILSLFLAGDTIDGEAPLLGVRPDNVEALTRCSVWLVPKGRLAALLHTQPELAEAFAREAAIAAQMAREWVVSLGQRTAIERIAHMICELYARMDTIGMVAGGAYLMPLTQVDMAEAQGLSPVHVNRVLQELRRQQLIDLDRRRMTVLNLPQLQRLALFDAQYLHLRPIAA